MLISASGSPTDGAPGPRVRTFQEYGDRTLGPEAIELAAHAGLVADEWQCDVVCDMLAVRPDGRWLHFESGLIVPRQNGKGSVLEIRALAGLFLFPDERLLLWSAHEYKTAMEGFRRVRMLVDGSDDLRRQVKRISNTNGEEAIELLDGSRLRFVARSKGSGRGFTGDVIIVDEAYAYTDDQSAALMPTMSARPNPQIIYTSSPPLDGASGAPLYALRDRGEAGDVGLAWTDYGLDLDPDNPADLPRIDDPREWRKANPAAPARISDEHIARERRSMSLETFCRERLGVWPKRAGDEGAVNLRRWHALADEYGELRDPVAFALDVTPDRKRSAIVAYSQDPGGLGRVELVDHRAGVEWLVERLVELRERWNPLAIALDIRGPAGALLFDLEDNGIIRPDDPEWIKRGQLAIPTANEYAAACGQLIDAVNQGNIRHRNQAGLNVAVAGAKPRPLGDAYAWGRRASDVDIAPLCAATLARWAYVTREYLAKEDPLNGIF